MLRPFLLALLSAAALGACAPAVAPAPSAAPAVITDAAALVRAMHARYDGAWYRTLYFTQTTSRLRPDSTVAVEEWREWMALPGRLRIEVGPAEAGNGVLFARDSTFVVRGGALAQARPGGNPLLLLGFDVYGQPPEATLAQLAAEGFALTPFRADTWEGRPAYVFGTPETKEVWVDAERLVFVRMREPAGPDGGVQDVRFGAYERLGGGWIAPLVEVYVGGRRVFWEEYADVEVGFEADPALFDPRAWGTGVPGTGRME